MLLKWKLKQIMRNCTQTEEDLDHLGNWVNRWQIQCSIEICKIISLGKRNKSSSTLMRKEVLIIVEKSLK